MIAQNRKRALSTCCFSGPRCANGVRSTHGFNTILPNLKPNGVLMNTIFPTLPDAAHHPRAGWQGYPEYQPLHGSNFLNVPAIPGFNPNQHACCSVERGFPLFSRPTRLLFNAYNTFASLKMDTIAPRVLSEHQCHLFITTCSDPLSLAPGSVAPAACIDEARLP